MVSSRKTTTGTQLPDSKEKKGRGGKGALVGKAEKDRLFQLYVVPNFRSIKTLVVKYTDKYQDVDDNYNYTLSQMYQYIYSYDTSKPLETWIHIVTKRACFNQNKKRAKASKLGTDIEMCSQDTLHQHGSANLIDATCGSLVDNLSDELYDALLQLPPNRLSPFLLYAQGLGIRDIAQAEWQAGHLVKKSEDVVKSRIYWARKQLQYILNKHGINRASYTSEKCD